jgi:hypothetical protein
MDRRDALNSMKRELQKVNPPEPQKPKETRPKKTPPCSLNLCFIGAAALHRHARQKKSTVTITSLYEIDQLIEDKKRVAGAESGSKNEIIEERLPDWLKDYKDCFSKEASDKMPPHRKDVDLKIKLEPGVDPVKQIRHAPLYKLTLKELEAVKQYLEANLEKGFIVPSSSPFASPILIAHTGQKLRFCVDFRRLNAITKQDQHPLPLIDELMDRLNGAKYFTKLDIR